MRESSTIRRKLKKPMTGGDLLRASKGMIDGDMVPNSIKCEVLTAQMASFGEPILRIATPAKAVRAFNDREHKNCETSLPPIP
jgi:hypothetical protein